MKHRKNGKIKYEHTMVKGLAKLLEKIESWPEIKSIIPGRIKPSKNLSDLHLTIQYKTKNGVKCLAKSDGVQEVFFVTSKQDELISKIEKL